MISDTNSGDLRFTSKDDALAKYERTITASLYVIDHLVQEEIVDKDTEILNDLLSTDRGKSLGNSNDLALQRAYLQYLNSVVTKRLLGNHLSWIWSNIIIARVESKTLPVNMPLLKIWNEISTGMRFLFLAYI